MSTRNNGLLTDVEVEKREEVGGEWELLGGTGKKRRSRFG